MNAHPATERTIGEESSRSSSNLLAFEIVKFRFQFRQFPIDWKSLDRLFIRFSSDKLASFLQLGVIGGSSSRFLQ
jgi:hypothetical protein